MEGDQEGAESPAGGNLINKKGEIGVAKEKILTKKLIDQILKKQPEEGPYNSFTKIENEAAIYLSKKVKVAPTLSLTGLSSLTDVAAAAFGKFDCCEQPNFFLYLDGLKNISDKGLNELAKFKGSLSLGGLKQLSDDGAKALASHKGGRLQLCGLTTLSDSAAKILSSYFKGKNSGNVLNFGGLTEASDETFKELSKYKGFLGLPSLKSISDSAVKILAGHQGSFLDLSGLKTLSIPAAKALAGYKGFDSVYKTRGKISLGKEAAKVLLKQKGGDAVLFDDE